MEHQISNEYITLTVSAKGAEMRSIEKDSVEYLWNGDPAYWADRAPLLFPYVGRFTKGKYTLNGKEYAMGIHGFASGLPFQVKELQEDRIVLELRDTEETFSSYPYHFSLQVSYALFENEIRIGYCVENLSEVTMYFGIGGHPGFRVPLEDDLDFEDYILEFKTACRPDRVGHTDACFLSGENTEFPLQNGKILPLYHGMFDDDAVVLQNMSDCVTLKSQKGSRQVTVSYPDLPYLGLWHAPKTEAPYLCIEPWTSLPSRQDIVEEFRCKSDLIRLKGGKVYENCWSIFIS